MMAGKIIPQQYYLPDVGGGSGEEDSKKAPKTQPPRLPDKTEGPIHSLGARPEPNRSRRPQPTPADGTLVEPDRPPRTVELAALAALEPDQVDLRQGRSLPVLIEQLFGGQRAQTHVRPRSVDEIVDSLRRGERLMPSGAEFDAVNTWFGAVDLSRLNDVSLYLDLDCPLEALMRDLYVAHVLGFVPWTVRNASGFNRPAALVQFVERQLKGANKGGHHNRLSWHQFYVVRYFVAEAIGHDEYRSREGQIAFVRWLNESGKINSTNLGDVFTAIDPTTRKALGWNAISLPLQQAIRVREEVQQLYTRVMEGDEQAKQYCDDSGQIAFMCVLRDARKIHSTNLTSLFTALEP